VTHWTFLIGALALAGIFPLAGFWSKDEILAELGEAAARGAYPRYFATLQYVALIVSALTAFYTFRAYFMTFWGETRIPTEAGHHAHESPRVMTWPLIILAACSAVLGVALGPLTHWFFHYLEHTPGLTAAKPLPMSPTVMAMGTLAGVIGIVIAWWLYQRQPGSANYLAARLPLAYEWSLHKFFIDEIYGRFIVRPLVWLARESGWVDNRGIDRVVDWVGSLPAVVGSWLRPWQTGLVQSYAAIMFMGVTLLAAVILFMS
jgi:NADH-quinone oxidoreductase subunit L